MAGCCVISELLVTLNFSCYEKLRQSIKVAVVESHVLKSLRAYLGSDLAGEAEKGQLG